MSKPLTEQFFTSFMASFQKGLYEEFATKLDLRDGLNEVRSEIRRDIATLQSSVDTYLKKTETWHDEFIVLKARHDRLSGVLVEKRIVDEDELAL